MLNKLSISRLGAFLMLVFLAFLANFLGDLFVLSVLAGPSYPPYCKGVCVLPGRNQDWCYTNETHTQCLSCPTPTDCPNQQ